jgi:hypothetical protein
VRDGRGASTLDERERQMFDERIVLSVRNPSAGVITPKLASLAIG